MLFKVCFIVYSILVLFLLIKNNVIFELFSFLSKKANNSSHMKTHKEMMIQKYGLKKTRKNQQKRFKKEKQQKNLKNEIDNYRKKIKRDEAIRLYNGLKYAKKTGNQDVINFATLQWNKFKKEHPDIAAEFQKLPLKKEKSEHHDPEILRLRAEHNRDRGSGLWKDLQRAKKTGNRVIIDYAELVWNKFKKEHPDIAAEIQTIPFPEPKKIQSIFENKTRPPLFG